MRESLRAVARLFVVCWLAACGPSSGDGELVSIEVEPANATLTYTGAPTSLDYHAIGKYADGSTEELTDAVFTLDNAGAALGSFTADTFGVSGNAAGKGAVIAQVGDVSGSTSVIVQIHRTDVGPGVPADGATKFPDTVAPAGAESPALVYPLDTAVMPLSVKAPVVQWEGAGATDDLYRVRVVAGYATVDSIVAYAPNFTFSLRPTDTLWQMLKNSADGNIFVTVERWNAATGAQGSAPITVRMIPANITGAIYYWNLGAGQMERIDADGRAPAIANPPQRPSDGRRCVACHTVSRDGRYLSGALWDGGQQGAVFDLANDAVRTADPAPTVTPLAQGSTYTVLFSTFNDDGSRLMINRGTGLEVINPMNGTSVATTGLPTSGVAHPAWSPDGKSVVFVNNITLGGGAAGWAVDYDRGDLAVMSANGDAFGAPVTLVPASAVDPAFAAPSWPSFSPDSKWIAYAAGINSRGRNDDPNVMGVYPGALFLIDQNGGVSYRLDTACGGGRDCYLPNFSPYDEGGYLWLVFYSTRDYGNAQAGTKGTKRRQLWVTAIDKSKLGTGDPSSVGYWLPDQDVQSANMSAYWAPPPPLQ